MRAVRVSLDRSDAVGEAERRRYGVTMGGLLKMLRRVQVQGFGGTALQRTPLPSFLSTVEESPCTNEAIQIETEAVVRTTKSGGVSDHTVLLSSSPLPLMMGIKSFFVRAIDAERATLGVRYHDNTERWVNATHELAEPHDAEVVDIDGLATGEAVDNPHVWLRFTDSAGRTFHCRNHKPLGENDVFRLVGPGTPQAACFVNRPPPGAAGSRVCPPDSAFMPTCNPTVSIASLMRPGLVFDVIVAGGATGRSAQTVVVVERPTGLRWTRAKQGRHARDERRRVENEELRAILRQRMELSSSEVAQCKLPRHRLTKDHFVDLDDDDDAVARPEAGDYELRLVAVATLPPHTDPRVPRLLRFDRAPTAADGFNEDDVNPSSVISFRGPWIRSLGSVSVDERGVCKGVTRSAGVVAQERARRREALVRPSDRGRAVRLLVPNVVEFEDDRSRRTADTAELFPRELRGTVKRVYRLDGAPKFDVEVAAADASADAPAVLRVTFPADGPQARLASSGRRVEIGGAQLPPGTRMPQEGAVVRQVAVPVPAAAAAGAQDATALLRRALPPASVSDATTAGWVVERRLAPRRRRVRETFDNPFGFLDASGSDGPDVFRLATPAEAASSSELLKLTRVRSAPASMIVDQPTAEQASGMRWPRPPFYLRAPTGDVFCNTRLHPDEAVDAYLAAHNAPMDALVDDGRIAPVDPDAVAVDGVRAVDRSMDALPSASPGLRGGAGGELPLDPAPLSFGHRHELDALATLQDYLDRRRGLGRFRVYRNSEKSYVASDEKATPDGFIFREGRPFAVVEAKCHMSTRALRTIPDLYKEQIKKQCRVTGVDTACFVSWTATETIVVPPFASDRLYKNGPMRLVGECVRSCILTKPIATNASPVMPLHGSVTISDSPSTFVVTASNRSFRARKIPPMPRATAADVNRSSPLLEGGDEGGGGRRIVRTVDECVEDGCKIRYDDGREEPNRSARLMWTPLRYLRDGNRRAYMSRVEAAEARRTHPSSHIAFFETRTAQGPEVETITDFRTPPVAAEEAVYEPTLMHASRQRQPHEGGEIYTVTSDGDALRLVSVDGVGCFPAVDVDPAIDEHLESAVVLHHRREGASAWQRWWSDLLMLIALDPDDRHVTIGVEPTMASASCLTAAVDAMVAFAEMTADAENPLLVPDEMVGGVVWRRVRHDRGSASSSRDEGWRRLLLLQMRTTTSPDVLTLNVDDVRAMHGPPPPKLTVQDGAAEWTYVPEHSPLHPVDYRMLRELFRRRKRPRFANKQLEHRLLHQLHIRGIPTTGP